MRFTCVYYYQQDRKADRVRKLNVQVFTPPRPRYSRRGPIYHLLARFDSVQVRNMDDVQSEQEHPSAEFPANSDLEVDAIVFNRGEGVCDGVAEALSSDDPHASFARPYTLTSNAVIDDEGAWLQNKVEEAMRRALDGFKREVHGIYCKQLDIGRRELEEERRKRWSLEERCQYLEEEVTRLRGERAVLDDDMICVDGLQLARPRPTESTGHADGNVQLGDRMMTQEGLAGTR